MLIYSSEQVLPYVYQGVHKETGKVYIGSRYGKRQKLPSHLDFPNYKTSAPEIESTFHEFDWIIVAEFFEPEDAYNHEHLLIHEQWQISKPNSLNKVCYHGKKAFNTIGKTRILSDIHKERIRVAHTGKKLTEEHKAKLRVPKGKIKTPRTEEHKAKLRVPKGPRISNPNQYRGKSYNFLTPDGFVIEQLPISIICSQFGLNYHLARKYFAKTKEFKGFVIV